MEGVESNPDPLGCPAIAPMSKTPGENNLSNFTVPQLKAICKERKIKNYSKLGKAALLEKLGVGEERVDGPNCNSATPSEVKAKNNEKTTGANLKSKNISTTRVYSSLRAPGTDREAQTQKSPIPFTVQNIAVNNSQVAGVHLLYWACTYRLLQYGGILNIPVCPCCAPISYSGKAHRTFQRQQSV